MASAVIVLGYSPPSPELRGRVWAGVQTFRKRGADHLVFSGGPVDGEVPLSECEIMAGQAWEWGVDPARIVQDDRALDTVGNAFFTRRVLDGLGDVSTAYVVTSCYHVERAMYVFERCYGDAYDLRRGTCHAADVDPSTLHEAESLAANRDLLDGVTPGDLDEIARRMERHHDLYDDLRPEAAETGTRSV